MVGWMILYMLVGVGYDRNIPGFHGDIRAWKQAELLVQAGGCHGHAHS